MRLRADRRMIVRDATPDDAAACVAIYAPYVRDTALSFEMTPPTQERTARRIEAAQRTHAWLVADVTSPTTGGIVRNANKVRSRRSS